MSSTALAGDKVIRIATEGAYPPFNMITPKGELTGFDVDLAKALCEKMNAECKITAQAWDGIIPGLLAKKYDVIMAGMSITDERKQKVNFTESYGSIWPRFAVSKKDAINLLVGGLKDKSVGVQTATTHANYLNDVYGGKIKIVQYDTLDNATIDLQNGRLDAVIADNLVLAMSFLNTEKGQNYTFIGPDITDEKWFGTGVGAALRKSDTDLLNRFNTALKEIVKDGTHKRIADKYFPVDIYDYKSAE